VAGTKFYKSDLEKARERYKKRGPVKPGELTRHSPNDKFEKVINKSREMSVILKFLNSMYK
jgi:hypothetical protein